MSFWQWYRGWLKSRDVEYGTGLVLVLIGFVMGILIAATISPWYLWFLLAIPAGITLIAHSAYREEK